MGYFRELPDVAFQSPLLNKNSSSDYIVIKNIFRRSKLFDYLKDSVSLFNNFVIGDGDRPDTIAEELYGDASLDYVIILVAGITNITNEWPLQDYEVYEIALEKYGSEENLNGIHHYETFEIKDNEGRQILPPNLIVDEEFKIDGTSSKFPSTSRYRLISESGNIQLDDKDEFSVKVDNIARAVTNLEFEYTKNETKREIDVLSPSYVNNFVNDLRDVVRYEKSSSYVTSNLITTENTNVVNP